MVGLLKKYWHILENKPFGKAIFSYVVGYLIPYTGSIKPYIMQAKQGFAEVILHDKKSVRNHLNSIHAIALANLGEVTTGIALHFSLNNHARAILTELKVIFLKKARGVIYSRAQINMEEIKKFGEITIKATLSDHTREEIALVYATWKYEN
jgi:acyl-coenzyme A thioesterase PaaI-like protein